MLVDIKSKAAASRINDVNKTILLCVEADKYCARAETVVESIKWKDGDGKLACVDFFPHWSPPTVAVSVWNSDPADVIEQVCGPLFRELNKPWTMSSWDNFKVFLKAEIDADLRINLAVQIMSPTGCEVVEVTETVKRLKCA